MNISKAVITAASPGQHTLPLQRLVDQQGVEKSALNLILDEVAAAGVDDICVVIQPGDEREYERAAGEHGGQVVFVEQPKPLGYGDAIHRAADFVGEESFLHLVGDHLYLSQNDRRCARQLIDIANQEDCCVSAVQATRENKLPYFGAIAGSRVPNVSDLYTVQNVVEKPTPTFAEQELIIAGLRQGSYLCFFGMHVLPASIMKTLGKLLAEAESPKSITLSTALAQIAKQQRYLAFEVQGMRYNIGMQYGVLVAQLALALSGKDRDKVLTEMVELLAFCPQGGLHE